MKLRLGKALLLALTVMGTHVSQAAVTAQQVVTSASYQLTEYDTSKTGRQRAIEKVKKSALSKAEFEYLTVTKMDLSSGITETKSASTGRVTDMHILSESLAPCDNKHSARCYNIEAEVTVTTARIAPSQRAIESRVNAVEMAKAMEELF
ncbi:hypothetical protein P3602_21275 [Vibrio parahaemolyticus]|uniref:hypothetical protein n=1 Tax=Vibrio TaxID=662 RepID=UPI001CDBC37F|nr:MULTISPECIES: hypothetical protein [Vibrio]MDF5108442.1 hypothetical protein [Vibrio parahaemolyticus]MCA2420892.1 hypothetical protein [Vibrio alginolyticus]MCA2445666.1 hypothetical protein [Vibrio alginolyticus]MDF5143347.1 hypothetical protein [Vibrio parahaemolyticus]MDF5153773.1 hypothetical protein [Vibrio parahaemolyticus]